MSLDSEYYNHAQLPKESLHAVNGRKGGSRGTEAQKKAARKNGRKGGRPRKGEPKEPPKPAIVPLGATVECSNCGKSMFTDGCEFYGDDVFCSSDCHLAWQHDKEEA